MSRVVFAKGSTLAVQCRWCDRWRSDQDREAAENGAAVTHGVCASCEEELEASIERATCAPPPRA